MPKHSPNEPPRALAQHPIEPGTVLEWMGRPVGVVSYPVWANENDGWLARCVYMREEVREPESDSDRLIRLSQRTTSWKVLPEFQVSNKTLWPHGITDEEEARLVAVILTDRG